MRSVLVDVQAFIMRAIGVRGLGLALESRSVALHGELATRFESLRAELVERDRLAAERADAMRERLDRLLAQISGQGGTASDRDETIQNLLKDLRGQVEVALDAARREGADHALGKVRAEISSLRADLAFEAEAKDSRP